MNTIIAVGSARVRRLIGGGAVLIALLAAGASPFVHPAIARADFDHNFYDWCMNNLGGGNEYCCQHAGGVIRNGACVDSATLRSQGGSGQTTMPTGRTLPIVTTLPATAANPA
jgi:hypothetical protein